VTATELHPESVLQSVHRRSTGRAIGLNWNDCDRSNSEDVHMAPTSIIYGISKEHMQHLHWRDSTPIKQFCRSEKAGHETLTHERIWIFTHSTPSLSYLCNMSMDLTAASSKRLSDSRVNSSRMTPVATEVSPSFDEPEADPAIFMTATDTAWEHRPPRVIKLSEQAQQKALSMSKATLAPDTCEVKKYVKIAILKIVLSVLGLVASSSCVGNLQLALCSCRRALQVANQFLADGETVQKRFAFKPLAFMCSPCDGLDRIGDCYVALTTNDRLLFVQYEDTTSQTAEW
jgi:hypothetical protein